MVTCLPLFTRIDYIALPFSACILRPGSQVTTETLSRCLGFNPFAHALNCLVALEEKTPVNVLLTRSDRDEQMAELVFKRACHVSRGLSFRRILTGTLFTALYAQIGFS